MQDRYAGDVGDFMKLGLLRHVCAETGLSLGINWYLAGDESHNADGKHVTYLQSSNTHHRSLKACDPDLMEALAQVVATDRSVAALEKSGSLPDGAITYAERLGDAGFDRAGWHREAVSQLGSAQLVFVDPDNGIRADHKGVKASKFAFIDELMDYADADQSLVIYHHADRSAGGVPAQVERRLGELSRALGKKPLGAVVARRGSTRFFFVVAAHAHRDALEAALPAYVERWQPHAEFIPFTA